MKIIEVVVDASFGEAVRKALHGCGIGSYVQYQKVVGTVNGELPLLDTHIFPGYMTKFEFLTEDEQVEAVREVVQALREKLKGKMFRVFVRRVEEL